MQQSPRNYLTMWHVGDLETDNVVKIKASGDLSNNRACLASG